MKGRFNSKQQAMQSAVRVWTCKYCGVQHRKIKPKICKGCGDGELEYFASVGEANKYAELRLMQTHGMISELEPHPPFPVYAVPGGLSIEKNGKALFTYSADFRYRDKAGNIVILDYKGSPDHVTALFVRNKLIIESMYQIEIRLV